MISLRLQGPVSGQFPTYHLSKLTFTASAMVWPLHLRGILAHEELVVYEHHQLYFWTVYNLVSNSKVVLTYQFCADAPAPEGEYILTVLSPDTAPEGLPL